MKKLEIIEAPHPILRAPTRPVERFDGRLRELADAMLEAMYAAPGIGLAAPQVGESDRLCVIDLAHREEDPAPMALVNPEIAWRSEKFEVAEEGCLSLPGHFADVRRPDAVRVRYQDLEGQERTIEGDGLLARCLQHEIDHLDGVLFIDHLSALKRDMIIRKLNKQRRTRS